jgi:hypothetical protein
MVVSIRLVYSIPADSTVEAAIEEMIEVAQRMIRVNYNNNSQKEEEQSEIITRINPAMKRNFELEIERRLSKCYKR